MTTTEKATEKLDREVLVELLEAADAYGRDVSDHLCSATEHEDALWTTYHATRRALRDRAT